MRNLKIKYKIAYSLILILICFSIASSTINYLREYRNSVEDYKITGTSLIKNIEPYIAHHLYVSDIVGVQRTLDDILKNNPDILYAFILNPENKVIAHTFDQNFPSDLLKVNNEPLQNTELLDFGDKTAYDFSQPIVDGKLGIIRIGISRERMIQSLRSNLFNILTLILAFIGIGILMSFYISKLITNPLNDLVHSIKKISKGNYKQTLQIKSHDEIGLLSASFNKMCYNLQHLTKRLEDKIEALRNKNEEYEKLNKEYKSQNEELYKAKEKAEESDKLKTAFLANLSHEIRTPMNGILGFAELLKSKDLSASSQEKYISMIEESGQRMLGLINDLVHISKIEAKQVEIKNEKTNLNELLDRIYYFFKTITEAKGLTLEYKNSTCDDEPLILVDSDKLEGILTNLINNALKYTEKGKISFGYGKVENKLQFWVKDTGIGIPSEMKELVFERFRQVKNTHLDGDEGSGLGLAISKAHVELMGGEIWLESELSKGSTFYFSIPFINAKQEEESSNQEDKHLKDFKDTTIIIAEDDEINFLYLNEILKDYHLNILHAYNGQEVLSLLDKEKNIKLILMDLKMPVLNGLETTSEIRKMNKTIPIIAQTAYSSNADRQSAFSAGCNDYIAKPINKNDLLIKIDDFLV